MVRWQQRRSQLYRRDFLEGASAAIGLGVVGSACKGKGEPMPPPLIGPSNQSEVRVVLERYFSGFILEDDVAPLGEAARAELESRDIALRARMENTYSLIAEEEKAESAVVALTEALQMDFELGRLDSVNGWELAHTELHLCILASLLET